MLSSRVESSRDGSVSFILAVLVYLLDIGLCARQLCRVPCAVPCRTWFRIPHSTFNTFTANSCIQFIDWVRQDLPPTSSLYPLWGLCVLSNNAHQVNLTLLCVHVYVCVWFLSEFQYINIMLVADSTVTLYLPPLHCRVRITLSYWRQLPCLLVIDITNKSDYPFAIRRKLALSASMHVQPSVPAARSYPSYPFPLPLPLLTVRHVWQVWRILILVYRLT